MTKPFEPIHPSPEIKRVIEELERLAEWHRSKAAFANNASKDWPEESRGAAVERRAAVEHSKSLEVIRARIKELSSEGSGA